MLQTLVLLAALAAEPTPVPPPPPPPVDALSSVPSPPEAPGDATAPALPPPPSAPAADPLTLIAQAQDATAPAAKRIEALAQLGAIADGRVLAPLAYLLSDPEREVRLAALRAIASHASPEALKLLTATAHNVRIPFELREESVRLLGQSESPAALEELEGIAKVQALPVSLRELARDLIAARAPGKEPALEPPEPPTALAQGDTSGQMLMGLSGAIYGGYTLYTVGKLGQLSGGPTIGAFTGALLGGATGYLLAEDFTAAHTTFITTAMGLGLWTGIGAGFGILGSNAEGRYVNLFAVAGEAIGLGASLLAWDAMQPLIEPADGKPGAVWTAVAGSVLGAPALHLVGQLPSHNEIEALGFISGLILGGATGSLIGRHLEAPHGALLATGATWGLGIGAMTGISLLARDGGSRLPELDALEGVALGGGLLGLAAAHLAYGERYQANDLPLINFIGLATTGVGLGSILIPEPKDDVRPATAVLAGSAALGVIGGAAIAPYLEFSRADGALTSLGLLHGLFAGVAVPGLFMSTVPQRLHMSGALLGASLGTLATGALAQFVEIPLGDVSTLLAADLYGSLAGLGGALLAASSDTAAPNAGYLLGGALSLAAASQLAPNFEFSSGDLALVALTTGWGAWQGIGFGGSLLTDPVKLGGATLLGFGVGGIGGMVLSQFVDLTPGWVAAASSGVLWGTWIAGFSTSLVPSLSFQDSLLITTIASDVGLGLTALLLSPVVGVRPEHVGITSLGGGIGAALSTLGTALVTDRGDRLVRANLIGTVIGLAAGAGVAAMIDFEDEPATSTETAGGGTQTGMAVKFRGLTSGPLLSPDGRVDGMGFSAVFQN